MYSKKYKYKKFNSLKRLKNEVFFLLSSAVYYNYDIYLLNLTVRK